MKSGGLYSSNGFHGKEREKHINAKLAEKKRQDKHAAKAGVNIALQNMSLNASFEVYVHYSLGLLQDISLSVKAQDENFLKRALAKIGINPGRSSKGGTVNLVLNPEQFNKLKSLKAEAKATHPHKKRTTVAEVSQQLSAKRLDDTSERKSQQLMGRSARNSQDGEVQLILDEQEFISSAIEYPKDAEPLKLEDIIPVPDDWSDTPSERTIIEKWRSSLEIEIDPIVVPFNGGILLRFDNKEDCRKAFAALPKSAVDATLLSDQHCFICYDGKMLDMIRLNGVTQKTLIETLGQSTIPTASVAPKATDKTDEKRLVVG